MRQQSEREAGWLPDWMSADVFSLFRTCADKLCVNGLVFDQHSTESFHCTGMTELQKKKQPCAYKKIVVN